MQGGGQILRHVAVRKAPTFMQARNLHIGNVSLILVVASFGILHEEILKSQVSNLLVFKIQKCSGRFSNKKTILLLSNNSWPAVAQSFP